MILALLLGGFGAHKFYLRQYGQGMLYLAFCWTLIPAVIAIFEAAGFAVTGEAAFQRIYGPRSIKPSVTEDLSG